MPTKTKHPKLDEPSNDTVSNGSHKVVKGSFYEKNKHLIGSLSSDKRDLSTNKEYLKGFGRSRNAGNR